MSFLELLPNEISNEILSYLPQSDLVSTSRLSRRMSAVSQPLLYTAPTLTHDNNLTTPSSAAFLRTILSPGGHILATCVRSLQVQLNGWGWSWLTNPEHDEEDDRGDAISEPERQHKCDIELLAAAATRIGYANHNNPDAQVMLLLSYLPRLHTLCITPTGNNGAPIPSGRENLNRWMDNLPLGLQLREFRCHVRQHYGGLSLGALLAILSLPSIRKVDVRISGRSTIDYDTNTVAPASSMITDLRFFQTTLTQQDLEFILKIPVALEYFSHTSQAHYRPVDLGYALQPLKTSLKHLHLRSLRVTKPIGSLRDWSELQTLSSSLTLLLGKMPQQGMETGTLSLAEVLPTGLRKFQIHRESYWSVEAEEYQAVELLRQKKAVLPRLETLVMAMSQADMTTDVRYQTTLNIACQDAGVKLVNAVY